jgi:undecaprenyl-diphosphatase
MRDEVMQWISQIVLGILQGLAEIFPVSSSAHLAFGGTVFASFVGESPVTLENTVLLHLGTFGAILVEYQRDVIVLWRSALSTIVQSLTGSRDTKSVESPLGERAPWLLLLSLGVTGALGLFLRPGTIWLFEMPTWMAGVLFLNGLMLLIVGNMRSGVRRIRDLRWLEHVLIGIAQGMAVIPGLSRFGLTLCAGLVLGLEWYQALKLSFLLSLPVVLGAAALEWFLHSPTVTCSPMAALTGLLIAGGVGWLAIRAMLKHSLHARQRLVYFGLYCIGTAPFFGLYAFFMR